jgi:hypothetical protein
MNEPQAHVFLSCGQATSEEIKTALNLADILRREYGFGVFVAKEEMSLEGIKEVIFPKLSASEYFVFIDFPRDTLKKRKGAKRGSLFSHQELAIASYLGLEFIGFRHRSVQLDGLSQFLLSNVDVFDHAYELPGLLRTRMDRLTRSGLWSNRWSQRLEIARPDPSQYSDADQRGTISEPDPTGKTNLMMPKGDLITPVRFYDLTVSNLHRSRDAVNCIAQVESIYAPATGEAIAFNSSELKWAGTTIAGITIPASSSRRLNALHTWKELPAFVWFSSFSDSQDFMRYQHLETYQNHLQIRYLVTAEGFAPARCTVDVRGNGTLEGFTVTQGDQS